MKVKINFLLAIILCFFTQSFYAQSLSLERDKHQEMLWAIKSDIKKNYYDPNFRGIDLEAKYKEANEKLKTAGSIGQMSSIVAQFLIDFDDSHLFFMPPGKVNKVDYGFDMQVIGDKCYITDVKPDSDAEKKGLKAGDEIYSLEGFTPSRENLWKMRYVFYSLRPRLSLKMEIIKPDGKQSAIEVIAGIIEGKNLVGNSLSGHDWQEYDVKTEEAYKKYVRQYFYDKIDGLFIWKMPHFSLQPDEVDAIVDKFNKKNQSLILDLRGNGGGRIDMLLRLIGNFFPEDVKVGDEKSRKETKEMIAKTRGKNVFDGKLVVLIDSESGSSSEMFSKVIQFEKRGTIIGDKSAGAVMESRHFSYKTGIEIVSFYGASIPIADVIMKDGKSLEKIGVIPDEKLLPSASDLADHRDPVLARAAEIIGYKISAEEAGKIFPKEKIK